ncbi:phosphoribosyltransferase-like protein [Edaphobacter flagellatus]|uniref:phosphoribosyltransferase-like protein n=1 Tax=Edaphobacter flagellatus TaxID=1933044 RepID=UPI0021B38883|nr:hypothetical protein [Edaphobacter flagellatus]
MNNQLAEELLSKVMGWQPADFNQVGLELQAMASYKYDEYQQFSPGMRFTESLARWLSQFTPDERPVALDYIRKHLVFISTAELNHLVSIAYPDCIRPLLLDLAAKKAGIEPWRKRQIAASDAFRVLQRKTLFLGLSDGARTDVFRRANPLLTNEQVRQSHEPSRERIDGLVKDLKIALKDMGEPVAAEESTEQSDPAFEVVVLMDDFSASGISYLRLTEDGAVTGKIGKFLVNLANPENPLSKLVVKEGREVILVLYLATAKVEEKLMAQRKALEERFGVKLNIIVVQRLPNETILIEGAKPDIDALIKKYYDDTNETDATRLGGTDLRYGFAGCGLPLVLSHNTPNNSLGLLWADGPQMRSLFPRVTRHKDSI